MITGKEVTHLHRYGPSLSPSCPSRVNPVLWILGIVSLGLVQRPSLST